MFQRLVHHPVPGWLASELRAYPARLRPGAVVEALVSQRDRDLSDCARAVRVPAAVVNGQHDRARGPVEVGRLAELLGVAATTVDSGHSPCAEVPERFAAVVRDVIARA